MIEVIRYSEDKKEEWNKFIADSKNGTFLFNRSFMDYHNDRFQDFSLMIYRKGKLISCFPANIVGDEIYSHQGLTYGDFVFNSKMRLSIAEEVLEVTLLFYKSQQIKNLYIKQMPAIYHIHPSNEMDYWLWQKGAEVYRKDTTLAVGLKSSISFSTRKKRNLKKALSKSYYIKENENFDEFWNLILTPNLERKYNVSPVHSLSEIKLLKSKFESEVVQCNVYDVNGEIVAGTTLFIKNNSVHAQYISANDEGTNNGALDYLFTYLIKEFKVKEFYFFDFGICNEESGKKLNYSLVEYKEGFGASTYIHEFYKLKL